MLYPKLCLYWGCHPAFPVFLRDQSFCSYTFPWFTVILIRTLFEISFNNKKGEIKEADNSDKEKKLLEEAEANSVLVNAKVKELETSQKALEFKPSLDDSDTSENIKEKTDEEESLDDYDYYEGFDEDGNKIIDHACWS